MHSGDTISGSGFDAWDGEELKRQQGLRCKSRKRELAGGRKPGGFTLHLLVHGFMVQRVALGNRSNGHFPG